MSVRAGLVSPIDLVAQAGVRLLRSTSTAHRASMRGERRSPHLDNGTYLERPGEGVRMAVDDGLRVGRCRRRRQVGDRRRRRLHGVFSHADRGTRVSQETCGAAVVECVVTWHHAWHVVILCVVVSGLHDAYCVASGTGAVLFLLSVVHLSILSPQRVNTQL